MKIKFTIYTVLILVSSLQIHAQNGTYNCTSQGYSTPDKSADKLYSNKQIIIIDINNLNGGDVTINTPAENYNVTYSIIKKGEVLTDTKERTITRTYEVYLVMNGEKFNKSLLAIVENMDNKGVSIWVYNEQYKSYNTYLNLKKIIN